MTENQSSPPGSDRPRLAIVTVTYNSGQVLPEFLASLDRQADHDWTVIVVDNASSDDSVAQLAAWGSPRLQLVRNDRNVGFAKATNQGIRLAIDQGIEWVLILNNDTSFAPDAVAVLMARAARGDAEVYAPHVVYHADPRVTWYGGGHFSSAWGFRATLEGDGRTDWLPAQTERWVDFAPGCCQLVSTGLLRRSGAFDEDFFVYWEDVDLCWRWAQAGVPIRYLASPVIRHDASSLTGGALSPFSVRMYHLNQILFLRKNFGWISAVARVFPIVFKIAGRLALGMDRPSQTRARLTAVLEGLRYTMTPGSDSSTASPVATA